MTPTPDMEGGCIRRGLMKPNSRAIKPPYSSGCSKVEYDTNSDILNSSPYKKKTQVISLLHLPQCELPTYRNHQLPLSCRRVGCYTYQDRTASKRGPTRTNMEYKGSFFYRSFQHGSFIAETAVLRPATDGNKRSELVRRPQ